MNLVINMVPLTSGGGQRVGLNMIKGLIANDFFGHSVHFFVTTGSEIEMELKRVKLATWNSVPNASLKRLWFEGIEARKIMTKMQVDIVYTVFGYGMFGTRVKQVCGVAYSNLFFPEIDFWQEFSGLSLLKKKLIDSYRKRGLNRSYGLIFENEAMLHRSNQLYSVPKEKTTFIPPSIEIQEPKSGGFKKYAKDDHYNVLMLCGWQRNKNVHIVPRLANEAKMKGIKMHFILTLDYNTSLDSELFKSEVEKYQVSSFISLIGRVAPHNLADLYSQANGLLLLSKLESFSNNIIEAWAYKVPLFITNHEWAQRLCKKAAFYVDRDNSETIVEKLATVMRDSKVVENYLHEAEHMLSLHPSVDEKTKLEIKFLERINDL